MIKISTLDDVIVALCLDYERRAEAIEKGSYGRRTLMEYRYINFRIYEAAAEIAGDRLAERFIFEIGNKIGYAKSELYQMSEMSYKRKKLEIKRSVAEKLHLVD